MVNCTDGKIGPCNTVVGIVELSILWISESGGPGPPPRYMWNENEGAYWNCPDTESDAACWTDFATVFGLQNYNDPNPVELVQKSMYIQPSCERIPPQGGSGGLNFGILAKTPVLVQ